MNKISFFIIILILIRIPAWSQDTCFYQVWQDDFVYTGAPDNKKWGFDIGGHGWGNQE